MIRSQRLLEILVDVSSETLALDNSAHLVHILETGQNGLLIVDSSVKATNLIRMNAVKHLNKDLLTLVLARGQPFQKNTRSSLAKISLCISWHPRPPSWSSQTHPQTTQVPHLQISLFIVYNSNRHRGCQKWWTTCRVWA